MVVRYAQRISRLRHGNFGQAESDGAGAFFTGDDFEGLAAGKRETSGFGRRENAGHQRTGLGCLISATPPWILASCSKISADCLAMASATELSMRWPFSA